MAGSDRLILRTIRKGSEEEQHEPQEGQPGNEGAADALGDPCGARGRHRVRITAASGANERCTRSSQVTGASTKRLTLARETRKTAPVSSLTR